MRKSSIYAPPDFLAGGVGLVCSRAANSAAAIWAYINKSRVGNRGAGPNQGEPGLGVAGRGGQGQVGPNKAGAEDKTGLRIARDRAVTDLFGPQATWERLTADQREKVAERLSGGP